MIYEKARANYMRKAIPFLVMLTAKGIYSLVYQLMPMDKKQGPLAESLCIRYRCDSLAGAGGMEKERNRLMFLPHLREILQRFLLVIHEFQRLAPLRWKGVLNILEHRRLAEESDKLILHPFGRTVNLI